MRRSISDRMSYRNHYMCSGEATSSNKTVHAIFKMYFNGSFRVKPLTKKKYLYRSKLEKGVEKTADRLIIATSGFATTHVVVFFNKCK